MEGDDSTDAACCMHRYSSPLTAAAVGRPSRCNNDLIRLFSFVRLGDDCSIYSLGIYIRFEGRDVWIYWAWP